MLPTPQKANYKTTEALLEEIPLLKTYLTSNIVFNGSIAIVRVRKKALRKKPLLYLFDISKGCYLSSLYPQEAKGLFLFEVGGKYYYLNYNSEGIPPEIQEAKIDLSKAS